MKGWAVWVTGLPGSGKSTIVAVLEERLRERGVKHQVLSIDSVRKIITPNPSYGELERELVYGSLVYTASVLTLHGVNVVIDATGNRRRYRDKARNLIERFAEVFVKCPLELCMEREQARRDRHGAPEKVYERGLTQKSKTVPGLGVPYEEPVSPEVVVESYRLTPQEAADKIVHALEMKFALR